MKTYIHPDKKSLQKAIQRPSIEASKLEAIVAAVLNNVKNNGDAALKEYTKRFDKVALNTFQVNQKGNRTGDCPNK